jgi:hypothetical protein
MLLTAIKQKLGASSMSQLIIIARRLGLASVSRESAASQHNT